MKGIPCNYFNDIKISTNACTTSMFHTDCKLLIAESRVAQLDRGGLQRCSVHKINLSQWPQ